MSYVNIVKKFQTACESIIEESFALCIDHNTTAAQWEKVDKRLIRAQGVITTTSFNVDFSGKNAGHVSLGEMEAMVAAYDHTTSVVASYKENWEGLVIRAHIASKIEEI